MARASTFVLSIASFALTALTVGNAFFQKKQFYPSVVYITKSSPSMAVMYIQGLVVAYMIFQVVRKLFFGELRASEYEHLSERTWHAIMETCLAFTVFRDDFSPRFVMQFVLLLFVKSFHWLSEDRVDFMERSPIITVLFHCRMMSLLAFLSAIDSYFISHAYFTTLLRGASVQIVFGFEYAILMTVMLHVTIKYILHMHDLRNVHPWENKAVYLLYSELLINGLRCALYIVFVAVMIRLHTFPLFSIRPLYLTIRAFHKAVNDVILSRRAIHAMNNLFPLATEQELLQGDNTCIICREEMTPVSGAKKLPCNHIFHATCLRSWFQRQQSCPTCRTDILTHRRIVPTTPAAAGAGGGGGAAAGPGVAGGIGPNAVGGGAGIQPGNNLPEMPNMFPFMAQFVFPQQQQQNQQQQQQQQPEQQQGSTAAAAPSPNANFSLPPGFPFMALPPFPAPPMLPFPPAPSFVGLTDEEVAAMEGRERAAVEARIKCIRDIGLLLDAATFQLYQYMSVVQAMGVQPPVTSATENAASAAPTQTMTTESSTAAAPIDVRNQGQRSSQAADSRELTTARRGASPVPGPSRINDDSSGSTSGIGTSSTVSTGPTGAAPSKLDEIRQRRLQKFGPTTTTANPDRNATE